ncbi:hypothetical protein RRG08_053155 [Elysia crispata]|uniref:C2H2-type domain-containing protein n=1 Tax=Elysia crispata TaxID=231223 RepID=A0AAE1EE13_9GAST|nr:hypothetical protein RRG08_053155 [Elysia crispata]
MDIKDMKPNLAHLRASMEAFYASKRKEEEHSGILSFGGDRVPSQESLTAQDFSACTNDPHQESRITSLHVESEALGSTGKQQCSEIMKDNLDRGLLNDRARITPGVSYQDFNCFIQSNGQGRQFTLGDQRLIVSTSTDEIASDCGRSSESPLRRASPSGDEKDHILASKGLNPKHPNWRTYRCDICDKIFTKSSHLADHQRIHSGIKPYGCDLCGKGFTQKSQLTQHKRKHTGERPYICGVCGKCFAENNGLINHMRTHSGEKPFKCDVCGKGFAEAGNLVKHKRIHSGEKPYKCHVCGKGFSENGSLTKHIRVHSGEKPYQCAVCQRRFTQSGDLKSHERMHSGERPYKCYVCGKGFIANSALNKHLRLHAAKMQYKLDV